MKQIYEHAMTQRENKLLPFLKMKIKDDSFSPLEISIRRSKNIINDETFRLIDEFQIMNLKSKMKNLGKQNKPFKLNIGKNRHGSISLNNEIPTLSNDEFLKRKIINMKILKNNKTQKNKSFKSFKLFSLKDKYLPLLEKYQINDTKSQSKLLETSKSNNNSLLIKKNKSNSNLLINETQINKSNPASKTITANKTGFSIKDCNKSYSKIFSLKKILQETQTDSLKIIKKIKKYKKLLKIENQNITDIIQKNEKTMKNNENNKDEDNSNNNKISQINNNKLLGHLKKNDITKLQKFQINNKELTGEILMKQSTINLLKFGKYFNKMDDEQFFKERKKIINKFAAFEKDSNILDGIKTERNRFTIGKGIQNNNRIIKQLAEDNYSFFQNVSKKYDNI